MSFKSNFKQAINELSGTGQKPEEGNVRQETTTSADNQATASNKPYSPPSSAAKAADSNVTARTPDLQSPPIPKQEKNDGSDIVDSPRESAVITSDTQIHGAIVTKSPLIIKGKVKGNILCEDTVGLTGEIEGNVTAMSIEIKGASIKGDLRMKNFAKLEENAVLNGNLEAASAMINGTVNGDMRIHDNVSIMQNSKISGDIYAGSLEIAKGAVISGKVAVTPEGEPLPKSNDTKSASANQAANKTAAPAPAKPAAAPTAKPAATTSPKQTTADTSTTVKPTTPTNKPESKPN